jgi:pyruvate formate lyase activating enzyme
MSSKELARKLEKVKPYLVGHDSVPVGGITVSGGEAMLQPEFVAALFCEAHARGLTTCIDTTGNAGWRIRDAT